MSSTRARRLAAVVASAVVAVTAAVVVSSSSGREAARPVAPSTLLAGIPESGGVLGDPSAPVTVTEFVDPQCPVCAAAAQQILPTLIRDYVKPGKVKLDARVLSFLGPDSVTAAQWADGARAQDRLWPYLETFFASQGPENSGYVTEVFLADVANAAGLDLAAAAEHAASEAANDAVAQATAEAQRRGVTGTPTFLVDGRVVATDKLFEALPR